jgi:hypothetical protein
MLNRYVLSLFALPVLMALVAIPPVSARDGKGGAEKGGREFPVRPRDADSKPKTCGPTALCLNPNPKPAPKPTPKPCGGPNVRCAGPGYTPPKPKPCGGPNVRCAYPGWKPRT